MRTGLRDWAVDHPWVTISLGVALLFGVGAAGPPASAALAYRPCGGTLPESVVEEVRDGEAVAREDVVIDRGLGRYACELETETDEDGDSASILTVTAETAAVQVNEELLFDVYPTEGNGEARTPLDALPGGLPGAVAEEGGVAPERRIHLTPACGPDRSMVVTTTTSVEGEYAAAVRLAVAAANAAAEALGCEAEPLPMPDASVQPAGGTDTDTGCEAIPAAGALPRGQDWRPHAAVFDTGPASQCTFEGEDHNLVLQAWYGSLAVPARVEMSTELYELGIGRPGDEDPVPDSLTDQWQPYFDGVTGYATAECEGQPAVFAVTVDFHSYVRFSSASARQALTAWATDQAERRGCTGLRLP
jgi:hypothetical protein